MLQMIQVYAAILMKVQLEYSYFIPIYSFHYTFN